MKALRSLQFSTFGNLTHLHGKNYRTSLSLHFSFITGLCNSWKSGWWDSEDLSTLLTESEWLTEIARRCGAANSCDFPVSLPLFSGLPQRLTLFTFQHETFGRHLKEKGLVLFGQHQPYRLQNQMGRTKRPDTSCMCKFRHFKLVPEPFFGTERQHWSQSTRHFLVLPTEGSSRTPHGEGGMMLLGDGEEEGPWTNHRKVGMSTRVARLKRPLESLSPGFCGTGYAARGIGFPQAFPFLGKLHPGEDEHEKWKKETKQKGINWTLDTLLKKDLPAILAEGLGSHFSTPRSPSLGWLSWAQFSSNTRVTISLNWKDIFTCLC